MELQALTKGLAFLSSTRDFIVLWSRYPFPPIEREEFDRLIDVYHRLVGIVSQRFNAVSKEKAIYDWVHAYMKGNVELDSLPSFLPDSIE